MASETEQSQLIGENTGEDCIIYEQADIERRNLLNVLKLTVKSLIEYAMRRGQPMDDDDINLQQLFVAVEHSLRHRLKVKRNLLGQKRSFWGVIEALERTSDDFMESVQKTRSIQGIRTAIGKGRAWIRISLMQKRLADYIRTIAENKPILSEWYEQGALILADECTVVISGLLMGLNVIDYTISLSGEDFDKAVCVIDLSHFLKEGNYLNKSAFGEEEEEQSETDKSKQLSTLLDQKAYLEELNRKLQNQFDSMQAKFQALKVENSSTKQQLESMIGSVEELTSERDNLKQEKDDSDALMKKTLEESQLEAANPSTNSSGSESSELLLATQRSLEVELKLRQQLEQEIDVMRRLKDENETALQLLEKSVHEKQNSIINLRKQLEETKNANLKIRSQLKALEETNESNVSKVSSLEAKVSQLSNENRTLETSLHQTKATLRETERTCREIGEKLQEIQLTKSNIESELGVEKQWRSSLQTELQKEKDRVVELTNETRKYKMLKQEHDELQEKHACVQETISEQEIALVEMGRQLSISQQKIADMKVVSQVMTESKWQDDKDIIGCQICKSTFSVAKRKHHCRNCGGVFCASCSDNTMQLASSAKPVRVCDNCYHLLLERSSTQ